TMERVAVALLGAALVLPACLVSQEDHIIQPLPAPKNQPPRILESLLQPPSRFVTVRNGTDCPNLTFLASVSDPDVGDTLIYNFYLDPDLFPAFVKQATIINNGQADRSEPASRFVTVRNGSDCPNLIFLVPVSDPDVDDSLIYNFYVDPDLFPAFVKQATITNNDQVDRSDPASYEVSFATPGPLQQPGDHVVEVLVADGALVNRDPQPKKVPLLDGGTGLDPTYAVTYAWTVTVLAGPCP
ncbi:MAG TPA: hypothetical protein VFE93_16475, partial [Myxococcaceae bacterium]|nr:hypothetical protein [Myxococcaceae bacterium]